MTETFYATQQVSPGCQGVATSRECCVVGG